MYGGGVPIVPPRPWEKHPPKISVKFQAGQLLAELLCLGHANVFAFPRLEKGMTLFWGVLALILLYIDRYAHFLFCKI